MTPEVTAPGVTAQQQAMPVLTPRPRRDALPEHVRYRDEGCDVFDSCLRCPLPRCRYDVPGGVRTLLNRIRDREIRRLRSETTLSIEGIAARFHVSRRTVFRVLAPHRMTGHEQRRDREDA